MKTALVAVVSALAGVTLFGCGQTPAPTPAPTPAYNPQTVQEAWINHLTAFGGSDVDLIMKDYDEESVLAIFNDACPGGDTRSGYDEYKGTAAINGFFTTLFAQLKDTAKSGPPGLDIPKFNGNDIVANPVVEEFPNANVFLIWSAADVGIDKATDTFFWKKDDTGRVRVDKQNIVNTQPAATCKASGTRGEPAEGKIKAGWENHFGAFGAQNTADILKDYDASSVIHVADYKTSAVTYTKHTGLTEIGSFFDALWVAIGAAKDGLGVPLLEVEPQFNNVFLVWKATSHPKATDSFLFNSDGIILRQNIVVQTPARTEQAWV